MLLRNVDADADDVFEHRTLGKLFLDELTLAVCEVADRGRSAEDFLEDLELDRRLVVGGGDEDALGWRLPRGP